MMMMMMILELLLFNNDRAQDDCYPTVYCNDDYGIIAVILC